MTTEEQAERQGFWMDRFGATASTLCALHCGICALGPALFGILGLGFLLDHSVELGLALVAVGFAVAAIALVWREHRSKVVLVLLVLGILALVVSRGMEMGGGHHEHHEASHHGEVAKQDATHEGEADERHHADEAREAAAHGDHGEEHEGGLHALGAGVGVLGGLLIAVGHLLNLRRLRQHREALEA